MKPSALTLALIATVSTFAAEPAPAPAPAPDTKPAAAAPAPSLSAEVQQQMAATLPGNAPTAAAKPADNAATIASIREQSIARAPANQQTPDPEVLELPKITVKQQPRPRVRLGESTILGPKAFNDELAKKNLGTLDRSVLNKFTLPAWLGGVSAADRAREDYNLAQKQQFMSDVLTISKAVEQTDPAAAKALRDAAAKP
jgi:hypothetical protein